MTIQQGKLLRQEAKENWRGENKYIFNSLDMKYLILIYFGHHPVIDKNSSPRSQFKCHNHGILPVV
jgi:hypothetical protein